MRRILVAVLALAGCSYTFDDEAPDIALVGDVPDPSKFPRLNHEPATSPSIVYGVDKAYWAAFCEGSGRPIAKGLQSGPCTHVRVVSLATKAPPPDQLLDATDIQTYFSRFYLIGPVASSTTGAPTHITVRSAGQSDGFDELDLPAGPAAMQVGGNDDEFVYWINDPSTTHYSVYHLDGTHRDIELPDGVDPSAGNSVLFQFTPDGLKLVVRDGMGAVHVYSTVDNGDPGYSLGMRPAISLVWDNDTLFTLGDDGIRLVPLDGGKETVLESRACNPSKLWFSYGKDGKYDAYYLIGDMMTRVVLDGSAPPEDVQRGAQRLLASTPTGEVMFAYEPYGTYIYGAGDGWIGPWRFMERGVWSEYSHDHTRVRWIEHAADLGLIGDLLSATTPTTPGAMGGAPLRLGRNVRQYDELPVRDGRVLAVEDHAYVGVQNRIVVIDEKSETARWVCPAAHEYQFVPNTGEKELLVDIVTGASGYDIARVPIPAP